MQLQTDHIAEQDGKIERLNNQVNEYLVQILCPNHVSVCMSDYSVIVCCLIGDYCPCLLDKEPDEYGTVPSKEKIGGTT